MEAAGNMRDLYYTAKSQLGSFVTLAIRSRKRREHPVDYRRTAEKAGRVGSALQWGPQ